MGDRAGVKFWGTEGWIEVGRGYFNASDESLVSGKEIIPYGTGRTLHHKNFIESVKLRIDPVVPVEIGHRSCTACSLGNIAFELNRAIQWNPEKESFIQDAEAHKHLHREYRNGYNL